VKNLESSLNMPARSPPLFDLAAGVRRGKAEKGVAHEVFLQLNDDGSDSSDQGASNFDDY